MSKYNNYCQFLEPLFTVVSSEDDFKKTKTIVYKCKEKEHTNSLSIASFSNKKSKIPIEQFCTECKTFHENETKFQTLKTDLYTKTGHILLSMDHSTRRVKYECGNCKSETQTFVQNLLSATSFCSKCQNDKNRKKYDELKTQVESHGYKLITLENEYTNNKQKLNVLCQCGNPYSAVLSDLMRDKSCMKCKSEKTVKTCMAKYGVPNVSKDPEIYRKICESSLKSKKYVFPSGRTIKIQGYENVAIDLLLKEGISEQELYFGTDIPTIPYTEDDNTNHVYFPDIYIKHLNTIVEIKCEYSFLQSVSKNYLKFKATLRNGYKLRLIVFNTKKQIVHDSLCHDLSELKDDIHIHFLQKNSGN